LSYNHSNNQELAMSNRRTKHRPPTGRGRPIGPVLGLAISEKGLKRDPITFKPNKEKNDDGSETTVSHRVSIDKVRFAANLVTLSAGQVRVESVQNDGQIQLTAGQRHPVRYGMGGQVEFDPARQVMDSAAWEEMQEPGRLLVVSGCLVKMATTNGQPACFDFSPLMWGIADPAQHTNGSRLVVPTALPLR
jgi:hypothetical protein